MKHVENCYLPRGIVPPAHRRQSFVPPCAALKTAWLPRLPLSGTFAGTPDRSAPGKAPVPLPRHPVALRKEQCPRPLPAGSTRSKSRPECQRPAPPRRAGRSPRTARGKQRPRRHDTRVSVPHRLRSREKPLLILTPVAALCQRLLHITSPFRLPAPAFPCADTLPAGAHTPQ